MWVLPTRSYHKYPLTVYKTDTGLITHGILLSERMT